MHPTPDNSSLHPKNLSEKLDAAVHICVASIPTVGEPRQRVPGKACSLASLGHTVLEQGQGGRKVRTDS